MSTYLVRQRDIGGNLVLAERNLGSGRDTIETGGPTLGLCIKNWIVAIFTKADNAHERYAKTLRQFSCLALRFVDSLFARIPLQLDLIIHRETKPRHRRGALVADAGENIAGLVGIAHFHRERLRYLVAGEDLLPWWAVPTRAPAGLAIFILRGDVVIRRLNIFLSY